MLRGKRYDFKDGGRGESWGQGHFTLLSAPPPLVLVELPSMLPVSMGILVLNSCELGI